MGKKWWKSKTLYVNVATAIVSMLAMFGVDTGLTEAEVGAASTAAFVLVNIVMRLITKEPIERSLV